MPRLADKAQRETERVRDGNTHSNLWLTTILCFVGCANQPLVGVWVRGYYTLQFAIIYRSILLSVAPVHTLELK